MDGDEEVKEGHKWFELAKWAKENRQAARSFDFYHDEDMGKLLEAFNQKRPESWEDLTSGRFLNLLKSINPKVNATIA
jgi:hypothetical protein